ncbi:Uncharacterized protein HZ326_8431 [Fusarium oxysporum f. sp. albedinis]|nr:Uncharacterized protein HZ326_8431 [Fusarium oxysporum f. sp. albedinis]
MPPLLLNLVSNQFPGSCVTCPVILIGVMNEILNFVVISIQNVDVRPWRWEDNAMTCGRLYQLGGPSTQGGYEELTLDYVMTTYGIRPNVTVRNVMDIQGGYLCYRYDY